MATPPEPKTELELKLEAGKSPEAEPRPETGRTGRLTWAQKFELLPRSPVTFGTMAVCIALFAVAEGNGDTRQAETLLRYGASTRSLVWQGEWWRLVSSIFLHIGPAHLFWNLWAGLDACLRVETRLGSARFLALYLLSGLAGSGLSVIGQNVVSAGASGALFGVIGAWLVLKLRQAGSWKAFTAVPENVKELQGVAIWFGLGATLINMDNYAHFGGLATGVALALALTSTSALVPRVAAVVGGIAFLVFLSFAPRPFLHDQDLRLAKANAAGAALDYPRMLELTLNAEIDSRVDPHLLYLRAFALQRTGKPEEALKVGRELERRRPDYEFCYLVRAQALVDLGRLAEAEKEFDRALLKEDQSRGEILVGRGHARGALDRWAEAAIDFRAATLMEDGRLNGWRGLCMAKVQLELTEEAEEACTRHLELDPKSADSFYNRAWARLKRGQADLGYEDLKAARAVAPPDWASLPALEAAIEKVEKER